MEWNRVTECFLQMSVIKGVESVRKLKNGLEFGQRLLRKLIASTHSSQEQWCIRHLASQISRERLIAFEPRFDFPDRFDAFNHLQ